MKNKNACGEKTFMYDDERIEFAQELLELYLRYRDNPQSDKNPSIENFMKRIQDELVKIGK